MTLDEIKDQYAKGWGYKDFEELYQSHKDEPSFMQDCNNDISLRYAKAKLEEASERAKDSIECYPSEQEKIKESITNINLD